MVMLASRRTAAFAVLGVGALLVSGCGEGTDTASAGDGSAETITVSHAQGKTEVPLNPETVLVFDMAHLDTLDALGVDVAGLPQASVPEYLSQYESDDYLNIGTLKEPDYEAVNSAEADLIVVSGRSAAAYPELSELAPTIDLTIDNQDFLESFKERTTALGEIFEKEDEVVAALAEIDDSVAEARALTADAGPGLIVLTSGSNVNAYGPGARFGMIHDVLGVEPAVEDVKTEGSHGEAISFEFIAEADPDWLFVVDRDAATGETGTTAQQVLDNELVAGTTAWSEGNVIYLDPVRWYIVGGGLTTVAAMIDQVVTEMS